MKEITVAELKEKMDNGEDFQLIDVREDFEYEMSNLGGELIPMSGIVLEADKISRDKPVIIQCRSGNRSGAAVKMLEQQFGFNNLYNLKGGILAWKAEIDPGISVY
ncbi:MAG: rhodanese-like domain-containing protein [Mucilaginibacter polytrichastri]|nr:rhodanese-like domain-containing protein [Mucilaginibacter polytrichastri]